MERAAFTIEEFCRRYGMSKSTFHKLQREGHAPRLMTFGACVRVTADAARDWQQSCEAGATDERSARVAAARRAGQLSAKSSRRVAGDHAALRTGAQ